jgi:hypothetical protein
MDTKTMLTEASPTTVDTTEPVAGVPAARPTIHHFTFYSRAKRDDLAAFAAAKVLLESAVRTRRETGGRAVRASLKAGPMRRHYVVRFMTDGRIATRGVDIELGSGPALLGSMSIGKFHTGDQAEFPDIGVAQTGFVVKVSCAGKRDGNMPVAAGYVGSPQRGTLNFTVVNGSVTHCVWTWSGRPIMAV